MSLGFQNLHARPESGSRTEEYQSSTTSGPNMSRSSYYHKASYKTSQQPPQWQEPPPAGFSSSREMNMTRDMNTMGLLGAPSPYSSHAGSLRTSPVPPPTSSSWREIATTSSGMGGSGMNSGTGMGTTTKTTTTSSSRMHNAATNTDQQQGYQQQQQQRFESEFAHVQPPSWLHRREHDAQYTSRDTRESIPVEGLPLYTSTATSSHMSHMPFTQSYGQTSRSHDSLSRSFNASHSTRAIAAQDHLTTSSPAGSRPMTALSSRSGMMQSSMGQQQWQNPLNESKTVDNGDHFLITITAPTLTAKDLHVQLLSDRTLKINGECFEEHAMPTPDGGRRVERVHNTFSKSYTLPSSSDLSNITSYMDGGCLYVRIAKTVGAGRRRSNTAPQLYMP